MFLGGILFGKVFKLHLSNCEMALFEVRYVEMKCPLMRACHLISHVIKDLEFLIFFLGAIIEGDTEFL